MTDNFSQGSYHTARNLSDLGDEYRALLGAAVSDGAFSIKSDRTKHDNLLWTRVLSLQHFAISGAFANQLDEDLAEAAEEIEAASTNQRIVSVGAAKSRADNSRVKPEV